ncbi:predicted protein, partial [Nematostella vectensis]
QAVGVGAGALPDSSMTASSERDNTTMASNARLNGPRSWCQARKDNRAFLEIDVGTASVVCGVATQGNPLSDSWVESFTIEFSIDRENWTSYGQNESVVFQANFNRDTPVKGLTKEVLVARYLRFFPMRIHQEGCLRVEIYATSGCFNASINVSDSSMIPDHRFSATSQYNGNYPPSRGRLHSIYSWEPRAKSSSEYLQVDLGAVIVMCAVATQGNENWPEWSLAYSFKYSRDNVNWHIYQDNGTQIFKANTNRNEVISTWLPHPINARFVRLVPQSWLGEICARVDFFG